MGEPVDNGLRRWEVEADWCVGERGCRWAGVEGKAEGMEMSFNFNLMLGRQFNLTFNNNFNFNL